MSEFDKIIGYDSVKTELRQLCDMIRNMEFYEKLGAETPKGLLLHGAPGVGKSLMARSFIKESGRESYIIRRNRHNGDFINEIRRVFLVAEQNAPSIIFLDDMDKFAGGYGCTAEYVAVQACIDEVAFSEVYVIATVNEMDELPDSLLRAGRFDRKIQIDSPRGDDAVKIIQYYIASKSVAFDANIDDIANMMNGKTCAELETILNEAAIYAGYERCEEISTEHIVRAVLRDEYGTSDFCAAADAARLEMTAYHEAGHVVALEVLKPNSIGLASLRKRGRGNLGGFVIRCSDLENRPHEVLVLLAGKAASELRFGVIGEGTSDDLSHAVRKITEEVVANGSSGISALDVFERDDSPSNILRAKQETTIHAEVERYLLQAKELLVKKRAFLNAIAAALLEKGTLLHSNIQKIKTQLKEERYVDPLDGLDIFMGNFEPVDRVFHAEGVM